MAKKSKKKYRTITFRAFQAFPVQDDLGIDLLRLMALVNDMTFVSDWMESYASLPTQAPAVDVDKSRSSLQHRLWMAFMFEVFDILGTMQRLPDFAQFKAALPDEGKQSLQSLIEVKDKTGDVPMFGRMKWIRDKTFHYDRTEFKKALKSLKKQFGENLSHRFLAEIVKENPLQAKTRYLFADVVRNAVIWGVRPVEQMEQEVHGLIDLHAEVYKFLDNSLVAYATLRNIQLNME